MTNPMRIWYMGGLRTGREVASNDRFGIDPIEFPLCGDRLMRVLRVYVPLPLRQQVLDELHASHFGINRTKSLAISYCWWEGIVRDIENMANDCNKCQSICGLVQLKCRLIVGKTQRVHVDFAGPFLGGVYFFILVDSYTKWLEVCFLDKITATRTIEICR